MSENKITLVHGIESEELVAKVGKSSYSDRVESIMQEEFLKNPKFFVGENNRILLCGSIAEIKEVFEIAEVEGFAIALLPNTKQDSLRDSFELSSKIDKNIELALDVEAKPIDILYAGDKIVLWSAIIGDTPPLSYRTSVYAQKSFKERMILFFEMFKKVKYLSRFKLQIKTKKSQEITTVASGMVLIEHDNHTCASHLISDSLSAKDGQFSALLLSPSSILNYLSLLGNSIFMKNKKGVLPASVGHIKSESITVDSTPPLEVNVDGNVIGQTPMKFEVKKNAFNIILPDKFWESENSNGSNDKETIKLSSLPKEKEEISRSIKRLPFFTHASESQYKGLFVDLKEEARASSSFVVLMILSTLLATVGLFLNSASVIIGAMLIAPLMQPIVAFSMGVLRQDKKLFFGSLQTVSIGILLALFSSALIAFILPFDSLTNEMSGRLSPSLLDLIVALISGVAAAYAKNSDRISGSLVGVSIAVALVPPIATAGIGLGWMQFDMFYHALLLFLTNFAGIVFAAAMIFLFKGFSPFHVAKKGLVYSSIFAIVVAIPLYFSFSNMVRDAQVLRALENRSFDLKTQQVIVEQVVLEHKLSGDIIKFDLIVDKFLSFDEKNLLKEKLIQKLDEEFILEIVQRVKL